MKSSKNTSKEQRPSLFQRLKNAWGQKQFRASRQSNDLHLQIEQLEERQMMDGTGFDAMPDFVGRDTNDLVAEVRSSMGELNETADLLFGTLSVVDESEWKNVLSALAPSHQNDINIIFADNEATIDELRTLAIDIRDTQTITRDEAFAALFDTTFDDETDWQTSNVTSLAATERADVLQSRYDAIALSLDLTADALEAAQAELVALLERVEDRVENVHMDFTELGDGPFSHWEFVDTETFGDVRFSAAGDPKPYVTSEGNFRTGTAYSGIFFHENPIFLKDITLGTVSGQDQWARVEFYLNDQVVTTGEINAAEVTWTIDAEIDGIQFFLGNADGLKEIRALSAEVTIPGIGENAPEILAMEAAIVELTAVIDDLQAESVSLLKTGYVEGGLIVPGTSLQDRQDQLSAIQTQIDALSVSNTYGFTSAPTLDGITKILQDIRNADTQAEIDSLTETLGIVVGAKAREPIAIAMTDRMIETINALNPHWSLDGSTDYEGDLADRKELLDTLTDTMAFIGESYLERADTELTLSPEMQASKVRFAEAADTLMEAVANYQREAYLTEYSLTRKVWDTLEMPENFVPANASIGPGGHLLVSGGEDGRLTLHAAGTGKVLTTLKDFGESIKGLHMMDAETAFVRLQSSFEIIDLNDGSTLASETFTGVDIAETQFLSGDGSVVVKHYDPSSGGYKALRYGKDGTMLEERSFSQNTTWFDYSEDGTSLAYQSNEYVNYEQPNGGFTKNVLADFGNNFWIKNVRVDGSGSEARIFVTVDNGSWSTIAVYAQDGSTVANINLNEGDVVRRVQDVEVLGPGLINVRTIDNYYQRMVFVLKLEGYTLTEVSREDTGLTDTADVQVIPDGSGMLITRADGVSIQEFSDEIKADAAFRAVASGMSTLNWDGMPGNAAGMQAVEHFKMMFREMVITSTEDERFHLDADLVWQKYYETNPHMTNDALAAEHGNGSNAYWNARYVRDADVEGMFLDHMDAFKYQVSRMLMAAYDAFVAEARYENPAEFLQELWAAQDHSALGRFESIGLARPSGADAQDVITASIMEGTDKFTAWQNDYFAECKKKIDHFMSANYGGTGSGTPTPRQLEQARIRAEFDELIASLPKYDANGNLIGEGDQTFAEIAQNGGYGGMNDPNAIILAGFQSPLFLSSLNNISVTGETLTELRDQLDTEQLIDVDITTLAGRAYLWAVDQLDNESGFAEAYRIAQNIEGHTGLSAKDVFYSYWTFDNDEFIRKNDWDAHANLQQVFDSAGVDEVFKGITGPHYGVFDIGTERYADMNPGEPEKDAYRNYESGYGQADEHIRVFFDIAAQGDQPSFHHVGVYLKDHLGNNVLDDDGINILLTPQFVSGKLYADIPLGTVLQYLDKLDGVQQGTNSNGNAIDIVPFKLEVVVWYGEDNATADKMTMSESLEIRASRNPTADISHLPELDKEILELISSPVKDADWTINMESTYHTGSGAYALDFNATNDNNISVFSPGRAIVKSVNLFEGTISLEMYAGENSFTVVLLHMDHIFEDLTGMSYQGPAEFLAEKYANEWNEAGQSNTKTSLQRIDALRANPTIAADLEILEANIALVQAYIDEHIKGQWIDGGIEIGQIGDEGHSIGSHLDMRVHDNQRAVNLFGWIDAYHEGITVHNVKFEGGKELDGMRYDRSLNAVVHEGEKVVMQRDATTGSNIAFALQSGLELGQLQEIRWDSRDQFQMWYAWNPSTGDWDYDSLGRRLIWNGFEFVPEEE